MEETWYIIYNCYGLTFKNGTQNEMEEEMKKIKELERTEAGSDGRQLKFHFICKKEHFTNLVSSMMV